MITPDAWSTAWDSAWADGPRQILAPPRAKTGLDDIHGRQGEWMDSMLAEFERNLTAIVDTATFDLRTYLVEHLTVTNGIVDQTPGNLEIVRGLNEIFLRKLEDAGYNTLLDEFTGKFSEQFSFLQDVLKFLSGSMTAPLPDISFSAADLKVFDAFKLGAQAQITSVVEGAAGAAVSRVMFSVGGVKFSDLVSTLVDQLDTSVGKARSIAETAIATFNRTITDRAFQIIEKDLPQQQIRYDYAGPMDNKTRPFCAHLLRLARSYTRAEIDQMNNGQLPGVFITGGGWNCRHVFLMATTGLVLHAAA
jgi:hypothetical protein